MARRYASDEAVGLLPEAIRSTIPMRARATRRLPVEEGVLDYEVYDHIPPETGGNAHRMHGRKKANPLVKETFKRHSFLKPFVLCLVVAILFISVLLSASMLHRPSRGQLLSTDGGYVFDVQVGGNLADAWQKEEPLAPKTPIPQPIQGDPYSVLGTPTITADFMNQVLAAYHSPAAGKGQTLYDLGIKYGIDPVFALSFFMHESTFGKNGVATKSLSLGNLRCIPDHRCEDNFAHFDSWEDGFEAWFKLIRNLYVAHWGRVTVAQIIPKYAPAADNNNEQAYINAVHHAIDVWRSGTIIVS